METFILALSTLAVLALLLAAFMFYRKKKKVNVSPIPATYQAILERDVAFYRSLEKTRKIEFENRLMHFLATTRITGVRTEIEERDKVYIAASAIIPIFGFGDWEYSNLNEVLVYPGSFNHEFEQTGEDRSILGMVGDGPYNNVMILSQQELRQAFVNKTGKSNTAIHEFVHLVDKTDGSVDGIPEFFMNRQYVLPWLQLMQEEMKKMLADRSDINIYGATDQGEFFAVVSEYFFERPDLLKTKHPDLYDLLAKIFRHTPG